jgi:Family of unknown function (DUF6328)
VADGGRQAQGERGESRPERINRELIELLNEIRVALPGVQFLFAFLLVVPFQQRITQTTEFQRYVYFVSLVTAAVATGLLIAPAAQHRVLFRKHDKEALLKRSSRSTLAGLVVLAVAIGSTLLLVVDVLFSRTLAWITSGLVGALLLIWWLVVPLVQRARTEEEDFLDIDTLEDR